MKDLQKEVNYIGTTLRRIAREMEDTAKGSSRVPMYNAMADELREVAKKVEDLPNESASVGWSEKREKNG